ncbi:hypothetical protein ACP4OV_001704 [Aristida adscensionis]
MDRSRRASMAMPPPPPSMSAAKVIVSTYEELPRRRRLPVGVITTGKAPAPTRATGGDYDRRTLLLAYVQQLRRRRRQGGGGHRRQSGPPLLEWCQWKRQAAGRPPLAIAAVAAGDVADGREAAAKLVLQAPVLRPALGRGVSPASQERQGERVVQERR